MRNFTALFFALAILFAPKGFAGVSSGVINPGGAGISQLTGDVTAGPGSGSQAATIANDAVSNAKLANMATQTFKGRTTGGTGDPEDLTATQATAMLNVFGPDSGSGGVKGLVPATVAGDATKVLFGNGTWATVTSLTTVAFGSSPNSNGGAISGATLTLQPANGSNPGGISLSAQTMGAGVKTFSSAIVADGRTIPADASLTNSTMRVGLMFGPDHFLDWKTNSTILTSRVMANSYHCDDVNDRYCATTGSATIPGMQWAVTAAASPNGGAQLTYCDPVAGANDTQTCSNYFEMKPVAGSSVVDLYKIKMIWGGATNSNLFSAYGYSTSYAGAVGLENQDTTSSPTASRGRVVLVAGNRVRLLAYGDTGDVVLGNQDDSTTCTLDASCTSTIRGANTADNGESAQSVLIRGGVASGGSGTRNGGSVGLRSGTGATSNGDVTLQNADGTTIAKITGVTENFTLTKGLVRECASVSLTADNQNVTVAGRSCIILTSDNATATNRTTTLEQSTTAGQRLTLIAGGSNAFEIVDDSAQGTAGNHRLGATRAFGQYDVEELVSDGTDWREISFIDN